MLTVRRDHTEELSDAELAAVRRLVDGAFDGEFAEEDWAHALGGVHVRAFLDGALVGQASVVPRTLWCGPVPYRTGYVEATAVAPGHRRRGVGRAIMAEVDEVIRTGYELGALSTSEAGRPLYAATGWRPWSGSTHVMTSHGPMATPDEDDAVMVLALADLDTTDRITCDWRAGDVW